MLFALAGALLMGSGQQASAGVYLFIIPILLGTFGFGLFFGIKSQSEIFYSYSLAFDGKQITRDQHNTDMISILYAEIKEITKNSNGSFTIKGDPIFDAIEVPAQIENHERLEQLLNEIKQVSFKSKESILQRYGVMISIGSMCLMLAVYLSNNRLVVGVCGTTLLGLLGYSFYVVQKSKNIDMKTKRNMWFIVVVVISILVVMSYKLLG